MSLSRRLALAVLSALVLAACGGTAIPGERQDVPGEEGTVVPAPNPGGDEDAEAGID